MGALSLFLSEERFAPEIKYILYSLLAQTRFTEVDAFGFVPSDGLQWIKYIRCVQRAKFQAKTTLDQFMRAVSGKPRPWET